MFKRIALVLTIPALIIFGFTLFKAETIHIAFVGPLSGKTASSGAELLNGIQVYVDHINKKGGINNHKIIVDTYDDKGDPKAALKQAELIVKENKAIGIIGHTSSDTANSAATVYDKHNIPTILPCATNINLTKTHHTLFRTIFNDNAQAEYMCLYAKHLLGSKKALIIYSDTLFGQGLKDNLIKYAKQYNLSVEHVFKANAIPSTIDQDTTILLATSTDESFEVISKIRKISNNSIIGPDSVAALYSTGIVDFPYDDVFTTTPLLSELIGNNGETFTQIYKTKYNKKPAWYAFYGHDSAKALLDALGKNINKKDIKSIRMGILNTLKNPQIKEKTESKDNTLFYGFITGDISFNKQEANKDVQFGILKANEVIASSLQLVRIKNKQQIIDFNELVASGNIIAEKNGNSFYKTQIVASGVQINEISALNVEKGNYMIDFYIWLRYNKNSPEAEDIIFLNSLTQIVLPKEVEQPTSEEEKKKEDEKKDAHITFSKIIAQKEDKRTIYKLFRIKNIFRLDAFNVIRPAFYDVTHTLGVNFRHASLDKNFIRYAKDLTGKQDQLTNLQSTEAMFDKTGWQPIDLSSYEDEMELSAMGNPHYINTKDDVIFSRFNEKMIIKDTLFSFFDFINYEWAKILLLASLALISLLSFIRMRKPHLASVIKMIDIIPYTGFLVSAQLIVMDYVSNNDVWHTYKAPINLTFDIIWWIIFAEAVNIILQQFVWRKLEQRTGKSVPPLLYWCVSLVVYIFALFGIVAFVLDMPVTSLLASTSLIAFLIVMAIQMNVSNIFSGIFLNVEGKFREGDWVSVDEDVEGWVVATGWRSTAIKTERGNIVNIPNSKMAEGIISNYNYPNNDHDLKIQIGVGLKHQPDYVKEIMQKAAEQDEKVKGVEIITKHYEGEALIYELTITVSDYCDPVDDYTRNQLFTNVWNYLHQAGISPALRPSRDLFMYNIPEVNSVDIPAIIKKTFKGAKADEIKTLIDNAEQITLGKNTILDTTNVCYVIGYGEVLKTIPSSEQIKDPFVALSVGQLIGHENQKNTYETLTDTILIKLEIKIIDEIISKNTKLKKALYGII